MKIASSVALGVGFALLAVASLRAQTVTGTGTTNDIPLWTSSKKIGNSIISQSGTEITVKGMIVGTSTSSGGILGESSTAAGVTGMSKTGDGVEGSSTSNYGVAGVSVSGTGVFGSSMSFIGVAGSSTSATGIYGVSKSSFGVQGTSTSSEGVKGMSSTKAGAVGESTTGDGIGGLSCTSCSAAAVVGIGKLAGAFTGNVGIVGTLSVVGLKAFRIDHPLDPANKYLNHFAIESNEGLDTYSGNVTTDASGQATVELPDYFEALNTNYRYQLTVIGQFSQAIILEEIQNNKFIIKTDKPAVKVSWQVTGVRSDAYVKAHPVLVEEDKPEQERGRYLAPEAFGQPEELSISWLYHSDLMREAKALDQKQQVQGATIPPERPSREAPGRD